MIRRVAEDLFKPVQLVRPAEAAARQIADLVRVGHLRVGDRLPSERMLAERLAISRQTLRDAVKQLVQAGLLIVRPGAGGGIYVESEVVPLEILEALVPVRAGDLADVLEARRLLEPHIAKLAAMRATDEDFDAMRAAIAFGREAFEKGNGQISEQTGLYIRIANVRLHTSIARATRNKLFIEIMDLMIRRLEPLREWALKNNMMGAYSVAIQHDVCVAIEGGRPEQIDAVFARLFPILETAWEEMTGRKLYRQEPDFLRNAQG